MSTSTVYVIKNDGTVVYTKYASINAAVTAQGTNKVTLVVPSPENLAANLIIPSTITLKIPYGGYIAKASTYTLAINGPFEAGIYRVFSGFASGDVTFGTGSVKEVYPEWWRDNTTPGTTDMTVAIQSAIAASTGSPIILSNTDYMTSTEILIDTDGTHIKGSGVNTTRILFKPLAGATCINLYKSTGLLSEVTIKDLKLVTEDAYGDFTKIGISLRNVSRVTLDNIGISGWFGNDLSIGLQTKGRELTTLRNIYIYADIPVSIENNPDYTTIDCDHFHFENTYLVAAANTGSVIKIESGIYISNLLVDGYNAWIPLGDGHGIEWNDTSSGVLTSNNLTFKNIRFEQTNAPTKYCFYFERTGTSRIQFIHFENILAGADNTKGWYIRNGLNIVLKDCYYVNALNNEGFNVDADTYHITFLNCFWANGTTATMTGQYPLFALWGYGGALPINGFYSSIYDINSQLGVYTQNIYPAVDNTYYLGRNNDDSPLAWKGVILKDTTNGKYYRIEVISGVVTATDLTD